jgi:nucleotide-binding universal stress UspA family protein
VRSAPCHVAILKTRGQDQAFRRILVPFDGGVFSRVAVEFAVIFAEVTGAEVTVAIVGGRRPGDIERTGDTDIDSTGTLDEETLRRISPLLASVPSPPKVIALPSDLLSGALAAEASSGKFDLVVIGAENRAVQHRLFFGAENERLLRSAPIPIALVIPHIGKLA